MIVEENQLAKLVPFDLIGNQEVNDIIKVGDGADKFSQSTSPKMVEAGTATGGSGNWAPGGNVFETMFGKNVGILPHNYQAGTINLGRETEETINKGGKIDLLGIGTMGVENGVHLKVGSSKRMDGDLEIALQG